MIEHFAPKAGKFLSLSMIWCNVKNREKVLYEFYLTYKIFYKNNSQQFDFKCLHYSTYHNLIIGP